jgi:cysteine-rich repeat protein
MSSTPEPDDGTALAEPLEVKHLVACCVLLGSVATQADAPRCGKHAVDLGETCDDDHQLERAEAVCGNGIQETGEECDDGNLVNGDSCDSTCHLERVCCCGNGAVDPGEECDDGNDIDGDGCSRGCKIDPMWRRPLAPHG